MLSLCSRFPVRWGHRTSEVLLCPSSSGYHLPALSFFTSAELDLPFPEPSSSHCHFRSCFLLVCMYPTGFYFIFNYTNSLGCHKPVQEEVFYNPCALPLSIIVPVSEGPSVLLYVALYFFSFLQSSFNSHCALVQR